MRSKKDLEALFSTVENGLQGTAGGVQKHFLVTGREGAFLAPGDQRTCKMLKKTLHCTGQTALPGNTPAQNIKRAMAERLYLRKRKEMSLSYKDPNKLHKERITSSEHSQRGQ